MTVDVPAHWLDWYGGKRYDWHQIDSQDSQSFVRRLGIVESFFDHDGEQFVGRADVTCLLTLQAQSNVTQADFRKHVLLAWSALRARHALLRARAVDADQHVELRAASLTGRCFVVDLPESPEQLLREAKQSAVFLTDHGHTQDTVDPSNFFRHCMNSNRCFKAEESLCRIYVLPLRSDKGRCVMQTVTVFAHEISDGLSANACNSEFIDLLNSDDESLHQDLQKCCQPGFLQSTLPPAQEALYHPLASNAARTRWKWAISRVLRHKRKPPLNAFANPLKRSKPVAEVQRLPPTYDQILDYSSIPPIHTVVGSATLGPNTTGKVVRLCREANASVGAGLFALVGMAMMAIEEERSPNISAHKRPAFVASFPLNVRPFLNYTKAPDSIMLSFSDGLSLPFLPSDLAAEGRFKLLVRQAHRQLSMYQKRKRSVADEARLGSRSPSQVIPIGYLSQVERLDSKLAPAHRMGLNPQGDLQARQSNTGATNGISSVGNRSAIIRAGKYTLDGSKSFAVDFRDLVCAPRAREGEFLCAAQGDGDVIRFHPAMDANSVDESRFEAWKDKLETMLTSVSDSKL